MNVVVPLASEPALLAVRRARVEEARALDGAAREQRTVTGHETAGSRRKGRGNIRHVVGVGKTGGRIPCRCLDTLSHAHQSTRASKLGVSHPERDVERAQHFLLDVRAAKQRAFRAIDGQQKFEQAKAHAARGDGADPDIAVEKQPHEKSREMFSSVKYPARSAGGTTLARMRRKSASALCRLSMSRGTSLLERRVSFATHLIMRSSSSSRRIVSVVPLGAPFVNRKSTQYGAD